MEQDVLTPELVEEAALIPRVSTESMSRLDLAVHDIAAQASIYQCNSREDFVVGDTAIGRIRQLDKLFEGIFTPLKRFHDALKAKVLDEERAKRSPLDNAKRRIGAEMIVWESMEKKRAAELQHKLQEAERHRAEAVRLAQVIAMEDFAKQTGKVEFVKKAEALLDAPLDIAPTQLAPTTMFTGRATKSVNRLEVEITDLKALLITIGATLLSETSQLTSADPLRARLQPYVNKCVVGLLDSEDNRARLSAALVTWARNEAKNRGEAFNVPGITASKKPGLG